MTKTELARLPRADVREARKIAKRLNINLSSAIQIFYRKKFCNLNNKEWEEY